MNTGEHVKRLLIEKAGSMVLGTVCLVAGATVQWTTLTAQVKNKADKAVADSIRLEVRQYQDRVERESQEKLARLRRIEDMVRVLVCQQNPKDMYCSLPAPGVP